MFAHHKSADSWRLPWQRGIRPLMLAPMQGLSNRAMRSLLIEWVRPDVVFTEFMRISNVSRKRLSRNDLREAGSTSGNVPLVVQLVGNETGALVTAARAAAAAGAQHINLNLGCPYGRMTSGATGGALLQHPEILAEIVPALRQAISGSFSIKMRAGYDNPQQIFSLLPLFEEHALDFLVLHPRTVVQKYDGVADHRLTQRVVANCSLPVIANGDIKTTAQGLQILQETGAAGLMLGRGALSDPLLFTRLREQQRQPPTEVEIKAMIRFFLENLLERYTEMFSGERQVLDKMKNVLCFIDRSELSRPIGRLKRTRSLVAFREQIALLGKEE